MNRLPRYVLIEMLKVFAIALTTLTLLMLVVGVMRQAMDEGVGLKHIVLLIPYILPDSLRFTIPATVLFAAACVYGRMSGGNEVVALKSLGISPIVIFIPTLGLAFLLSWVTVWLNDVAVSWGRDGVHRVVIGALEDIVLSRLQMRREYSTRNFSVIVKDVQDRTLIEPTFTYRDKKSDDQVTLRCARARLEAKNSFLRVTCYDGFLTKGRTTIEFPGGTIQRDLDLRQFRNDDSADWSPSNMSLREIYHGLQEHPRKIAAVQREQAAKAAFHMLAGDFDALTGLEWETEQRVLEKELIIYNRLRTEPPRRVANGFSCLCFLLVGSAMAIRRRNADVLSSFFLCFLPILLVYYPLLAFSVDQAKVGALHPYVVWLGNVVLVLWGLWIWRRVMRY